MGKGRRERVFFGGRLVRSLWRWDRAIKPLWPNYSLCPIAGGVACVPIVFGKVNPLNSKGKLQRFCLVSENNRPEGKWFAEKARESCRSHVKQNRSQVFYRTEIPLLATNTCVDPVQTPTPTYGGHVSTYEHRNRFRSLF